MKRACAPTPTTISAYGCFAIRIDIPAADLVKWEWDCCDPMYAYQVDKLAHETILTPGANKLAEITYAMMSNTFEATLIDDIGIRNVHFNNAQGMVQCFSHVNNSRFLLQLAMSVVTGPCGKEIHIKVDLEIGTSNHQGTKHLEAELYIANGISSQFHVVDSGKVEMSVI